MRIGDKVIFTHGAMGMEGTVTSYLPTGLVEIHTEHGIMADSPLNLICTHEADPKLVTRLRETYARNQEGMQ